ncbi:MAG: metallophosphoesterase [Paracoccaceae bacterium]
MLTRRAFFRAALGATGAATGAGAYAFGIEPGVRLVTARWQVRTEAWSGRPPLRIAALADIHIGPPWVTLARLERIVARTNALEADLIVLLGDYVAGHRFVSRPVPVTEVARVLAGLRAPLGVHAILGNHDWWDDLSAQRDRRGPIIAHRALEAVGIPVLENAAIRLAHRRQAVWLAGLGDQLAFLPSRRPGRIGVDDLPATLAALSDDAPAILLAHEPDIFPAVPERVALTLSGHTHGGQVRLLGYSPVVPSRYGNRYAYGHVTERGRHLVVSGGIGCSILPVRVGVPPEITLVTLEAPP